MRSAWLLIVALLVCSLGVVTSKALFGWWEGAAPQKDWSPVTKTTEAAQKVLGKKFSLVNFYGDLCPEEVWEGSGSWYDGTMELIWNKGHVPVFSWRPNPCRDEQGNPKVNGAQWVQQLARGEQDKFLNMVAEEIRDYLAGPDKQWGTTDDRRLYISFGAEPNGYWEGYWSVPADYKKLWRHVVSIFRSKLPPNHKTHLQFIWTVINIDDGEKGVTHKAEEYYPGSDIVDWMGLDGYNWDGGKKWPTPKKVFSDMIKRLRKLGPKKPLAIVESSSTSFIGKPNKHSQSRKNKWISQTINYLIKSKVKMLLWFQQNKEQPWQIFTPKRCWNGYFEGKTFVTCKGLKSKTVSGTKYVYFPAFLLHRKSYWIASSTKPGIVTDAQFLGRA